MPTDITTLPPVKPRKKRKSQLQRWERHIRAEKAYRLRYVSKFSIADIAEKLSVSPQTISQDLEYARKEFARLLTEKSVVDITTEVIEAHDDLQREVDELIMEERLTRDALHSALIATGLIDIDPIMKRRKELVDLKRKLLADRVGAYEKAGIIGKGALAPPPGRSDGQFGDTPGRPPSNLGATAGSASGRLARALVESTLPQNQLEPQPEGGEAVAILLPRDAVGR